MMALYRFTVRSFLHSVGMNNTKILAKVETRQALLNFQVRRT
jgi:pyruvate kinase